MEERKLFTPFEVSCRVAWVGGVVESVMGGFDEDDIDDATPEGCQLKELWRELRAAYLTYIDPIARQIDDLLDASEAEEDLDA